MEYNSSRNNGLVNKHKSTRGNTGKTQIRSICNKQVRWEHIQQIKLVQQFKLSLMIFNFALFFPYYTVRFKSKTAQINYKCRAANPCSVPAHACVFLISSTLSCDFWCFCEVITGKNIVKEIESIMGARAEQSSPWWVSIPQKSFAIAHDFWNTNSLGWTLFHTGNFDGFSVAIITEFGCHWTVDTGTGWSFQLPTPPCSAPSHILNQTSSLLSLGTTERNLMKI